MIGFLVRSRVRIKMISVGHSVKVLKEKLHYMKYWQLIENMRIY